MSFFTPSKYGSKADVKVLSSNVCKYLYGDFCTCVGNFAFVPAVMQLLKS